MKSFNNATGNGLFRGFLFYAVLALSFAMGASAQPGIKTDIVFVLVPAEAKPTINGMDSLSPSNRYVDGCRIVRLSPSDNGGAPIPLTTEFLSARDPEVSFDGQNILFAGKRQKGEPWGIWRMDTDGGNKVRVTVTQGMEDAVSPLYVGSLFHLDDKSPTRKILYQGKEGKLYTCDLDGENPRRITFNVFPEFEPDVLPNGRVIFTSVKEDGDEKVLDLLAINIDGTDLMDYVTGPRVPGNKEMVRVGRDGRVYFIESDGDGWLGASASRTLGDANSVVLDQLGGCGASRTVHGWFSRSLRALARDEGPRIPGQAVEGEVAEAATGVAGVVDGELAEAGAALLQDQPQDARPLCR